MGLSQLAVTVRIVPSDTTLEQAARQMMSESIGSLLIREDADGPVRGIVTDRDIVKQIAAGLDPKTATLEPFVGVLVHTAPEGASAGEITRTMRQHGVRRIPLVNDEGDVTGLVSLDDVLLELGQQLFDLSRAIHAEFHHEAPAPDPDE